MLEILYETLAKYGYNLPLHPPLTYLPLGLIVGAFFFVLGAWLFRGSSLGQTAKHCIILSFIGIFPAIVAGILDWQHRFAGAWLFPIKVKLALSATLIGLVAIAISLARKARAVTMGLVLIFALCLANGIVIGYFGGELVYVENRASTTGPQDPVSRGAAVFDQNCSACHLTDSTDTKIGPGLQGIFRRETFPVSGLPANAENFHKLLRTPYSKMPSFAQMPEEKIAALLAYLQTL
jgi:mono/diheme cytochrome c family protein